MRRPVTGEAEKEKKECLNQYVPSQHLTLLTARNKASHPYKQGVIRPENYLVFVLFLLVCLCGCSCGCSPRVLPRRDTACKLKYVHATESLLSRLATGGSDAFFRNNMDHTVQHIRHAYASPAPDLDGRPCTSLFQAHLEHKHCDGSHVPAQ